MITLTVVTIDIDGTGLSFQTSHISINFQATIDFPEFLLVKIHCL